MKINKIILKTIIIALLIIICNSCMCYAEDPATMDGYDGAGTSDTSASTTGGTGAVGLPSLDGLAPTVQLGSAESILETILGVATVIGVICMVISIALIGFNIILGSASEKAAGQEKIFGLFIAATLITGCCSIAKMFITIAEKI